MLILPVIIGVLSAAEGCGGIAFGAKGAVDLIEASSTDRATRMRNEKNVLRFHACSEKLTDSLEDLGKQRAIIAKNFNVFSNSFEKIQNRPEFIEKESVDFPTVNFDEIKNVSIAANEILGTVVGAMGGSVMSAIAASGMTSAIIAVGKASTGTKICELSGAALEKAVLAQLGGGALAGGGGGMALGKIILGVAQLGTGVLVEGVALAYTASKTKKKANEANKQMEENEGLIYNAIDTQVTINKDVIKIKEISVKLCNSVYKPLVLKLKQLVSEKNDWNEFTDEEKLLVENNILVVQILHYLNNIQLYKVVTEGEYVKDAEPNTEEVNSAVEKSKDAINSI